MRLAIIVTSIKQQETIMKKRSLVTFARKLLKIKGKSEHNGRGVWMMDFDVTTTDLKQRLQLSVDKLIVSNPELIECFERTDGVTRVTFSSKHFNEHYRTLVHYETDGGLCVVFSSNIIN